MQPKHGQSHGALTLELARQTDSAAGVVVKGQLGGMRSAWWHDAKTQQSVQAAGLWARLLSLPHYCLAAQRARPASAHPRSLLTSRQNELHAPFRKWYSCWLPNQVLSGQVQASQVNLATIFVCTWHTGANCLQ